MSKENGSNDPSKDFTSVPLIKVQPNIPLPTDVYLRIADKYIKFKEVGDSIDDEKYNFFLSKHLKYIYIKISQVNDFMSWMKKEKERAIQEMVDVVGKEKRSLVIAREEIKEKVFETFADQELNSENLKVIQATVAIL